MKKDRGNYILTYSGKKFYHADPRAADITIGDIAHSLSLLCRFAGHVKEFYSVGQHCLEVSNLLPSELKLWGLLHDATEAYFVDVPRPLKHMPGMEFYRHGEHELMKVIARKFKLKPLEEPPEVKVADGIMLVTEQRDLMNYISYGPIQPRAEKVKPLESVDVELAYLERFKELTKRAA